MTKDEDLTNGPLLSGLIRFSIPIMLTGLLQLLFNAADLVVVGRYGSDHSLAAVGATGALINLLINLFMGLSVGAAVSVSQAIGARNDKAVHRIVHTAIATSLVGGVVVCVAGCLCAETFLAWMKTDPEVIDLSTLYMQIYFIGMPASMVYNYGAAIIRSAGDTRRPLYILTFAGVINVVMNMIFVIAFHMDVAGVALATTISQTISAVLVVLHLVRVDDSYRLDFRKLHFYWKELKAILRVGIPAGVQGAVFSFSNVIIQSSINFFGAEAMSGNAAAGNIEGFLYVAMNSFHQTALTYTGQNFGARKKKRIKKVFLYCVILVSIVGIGAGGLMYLFREPLLRIYEPENTAVVDYGKIRMGIITLTYFTCGILDVISGMLRGLGVSMGPMLITLACICGMRMLWIFTVFEAYQSLFVLYLSYPISWCLCIVIQLLYYIRVKRTVLDRIKEEQEESVAV